MRKIVTRFVPALEKSATKLLDSKHQVTLVNFNSTVLNAKLGMNGALDLDSVNVQTGTVVMTALVNITAL